MKKHYRHENNCLNCGTTLEGKFCHNCGQENLELKESFGHMMNHAISDYFHFDQQFFHTLKPLLFKPGYLTNEYMAGRRASYLHPVKMYIFISIVYFLLLFQSGHEPVKINSTNGKNPVNTQKIIDSVNTRIAKDPNISVYTKKKILAIPNVKTYTTKFGKITIKKGLPNNNDEDEHTGSFLSPKTSDTSYEEYIKNQDKLPADKMDGFLKRAYNRKAFSYKEKYGARAKEVFFDEFKHNAPKMMFIMLPLVALILKVTFWKNKKFYVEHLIFTFHLHCFLFLFLAFIMLLQMVIPVSWQLDDWLSVLAFIYIVWYIYRSLRAMYQRSRLRTVTKLFGMSFVYFFTFTFCILLVVFITVITLA